MGLLEVFTETVEFDRYEDIRKALFDKNLSRTFDKRSYEEGNIRDGMVSIMHGSEHRARRRVANTMFRPERLRLYERELFPQVLNTLLDKLIDQRNVDLFPLGEILSVVLAARRAGLDCDSDSLDELRRLVHYVDVFSQGSAILDAKDPDAVRIMVKEAHAGFKRDFMAPARARREEALARYRASELSEDDLPYDILTVMLMHREDPQLSLDDGRLTREVATYLQGGTHTSSQTLINALDLLFPLAEQDPSIWERVTSDTLYAQRCVHETLRLRPTTPKIKRRCEDDTEIGGRRIPKDALVILNVVNANRDPELFGPDADQFNPLRTLAEDLHAWGLSFGAGPHTCPGRSVAGGLPAPASGDVGDQHLFGLVALMVQEVARRGVRKDPDAEPRQDKRTERFTRWASYPVVFEVRRTVGASQ